jgi:Flp pilus assembly protein TadG
MFAPRLQRMRSNRPACGRRGAAAVETLLVLPLFLAILLGMVGIADLTVTEQLLNEASGRAVRTAALGGTEEQVRASVRAVLGDKRSEHAKITVIAVNGEPGPIPPGALIEVRVEIDARHATATSLAPISGDEPLFGRSVMQRE